MGFDSEHLSESNCCKTGVDVKADVEEGHNNMSSQAKRKSQLTNSRLEMVYRKAKASSQ